MLLSFKFDPNNEDDETEYSLECGRHDRLPVLLQGNGFCEEMNGPGEGGMNDGNCEQ
jgi:hypothetical protein